MPEHQTTNKQTTIPEFLSISIILFTDDCISEIKHLFSYLRLSNPSYHTVSFISPLTLIHHCVSVSKEHTWNNITFCFTSGLLCSTCWPPFLFFIFRLMFLFDLIFIVFFCFVLYHIIYIVARPGRIKQKTIKLECVASLLSAQRKEWRLIDSKSG